MTLILVGLMFAVVVGAVLLTTKAFNVEWKEKENEILTIVSIMTVVFGVLIILYTLTLGDKREREIVLHGSNKFEKEYIYKKVSDDVYILTDSVVIKK